MVTQILKRILVLFFRPFRYFNRKRMIVLAYHDIKDERLFEGQLTLLQQYYHPISITDLSSHIIHKTPLPDYAVLVTFDDGDPTVRNIGVRLLQKHRIPAVAFVISENIRAGQKFWWKIIQDYFNTVGKGYEEARKEVKRLKGVSNQERNQVLQEIAHLYPDLATDDSSLTVPDLVFMEEHGITIGSHTATHPILTCCNEDELETEFSVSRSFFENSGIATFKYFAYPNGDYDKRMIPFLKRHGIALAFTFDHRINKRIIDPYCISRVRINSDNSLTEFKLRIAGISSIKQVF